ncbi:TonB-dependent copper receptor [Citrobacter koseri]|uniref:TonB-dependent copper receptor n=1 Tax=Citrobacter koseri TaxID=545 RepID=A0A2X2UQC0_CITKO|nr:TonB-dependent copper receptor [Citrobacter koseri]
MALGWTPDKDTLLEMTAGKGDGEARYAGRSMDGSRFRRESLGMRFEKSGIGEVFDKLEANIYYNYANHVMDNYLAARSRHEYVRKHGFGDGTRFCHAFDEYANGNATGSPYRWRTDDGNVVVVRL